MDAKLKSVKNHSSVSFPDPYVFGPQVSGLKDPNKIVTDP
jgi:hypothetical protein